MIFSMLTLVLPLILDAGKWLWGKIVWLWGEMLQWWNSDKIGRDLQALDIVLDVSPMEHKKAGLEVHG